jgi:hypothetical protein
LEHNPPLSGFRNESPKQVDLFAAYFLLPVCLAYSHPEDGGSVFLRNIARVSPPYTALYIKKLYIATAVRTPNLTLCLEKTSASKIKNNANLGSPSSYVQVANLDFAVKF